MHHSSKATIFRFILFNKINIHNFCKGFLYYKTNKRDFTFANSLPHILHKAMTFAFEDCQPVYGGVDEVDIYVLWTNQTSIHNCPFGNEVDILH